MKNEEAFISTSTRPIDTKLGKVMAQGEELPLSKPHVHLMVWSRDGSDKMKTLYLHFHRIKIDKDKTWNGYLE